MSELERLWLAEAAFAGRFIPAAEFRAKFEQKSPWEQKDGHFFSAARWDPLLLEAVLCSPDGSANRTVLPQLIEPLQLLLPKPVPQPVRAVAELPGPQDAGSDRKPLHVFESERIAPMESARILRFVQAGKLKVTEASQRPTNATVRVIHESLVVPDFALELPVEEQHSSRNWNESSGPALAPQMRSCWTGRTNRRPD